MNELEQAMRHPDVIKNQIKQNGGRKTFVPYSPSNPPPYPVTSVNGQTGDVDIPTVDLPLPISEGGHAATTAAQAAKNLGVLPLGEVVTKIPSGADLNDYVSPGVYAIGSNNTAATIANIPSQSAGTLRVFASTGAAITASTTWKYLIQEYIVFTGERYQRYGESGSGTAVTWDAWKTIYTSANFSLPVPVSKGGTGANNAADARANLAVPNMQTDTFPTLLPPDGSGNWIKIGKANSSYGLLPSQEGGGYGSGHNYLGASTWYWKGAYVDNYYGGWAGDTISIDKGGTGATTAAAARTNLGVPYISTIRQKITVPYTAESDGIVEIQIRLDTTGRGYAIYSGSFVGFIDGYTVAQGYITGMRPVKKGSVIDVPSSQSNVLSIDYYWTSFSN